MDDGTSAGPPPALGAGTEEGAKKRQWGVDTYSKWDNLDPDADSDDDERKEQAPARGDGAPKEALGPARPAPTSVASALLKSTQFNLGASTFAVKDVDHVTEQLEAAKGKRIRSLPQDANEVWQVVVRKLRVWSAASSGADEGDEAVPCRPYCVLVSSLFPEGKLLSQELCVPPEAYPSPRQILDCLVSAMFNPLFGPQRKPRCLTFSDGDLAGELFKSLARWKVEVSQLSESEGVDEVVAKFSELLVAKDFANVGPTSERPGLCARPDVSLGLVRALHETSAAFARREPWRTIHERKAFELRIHDSVDAVVDGQATQQCTTVHPGRVWVSVLGHDAFRAAQRAGKVRGGEGTFGIAVFFSRLDLEARLVPAGERLFVNAGDTDRAERCAYTGQTSKDLGRDLKRTKPPKMDIRSGQELLYADADALRAHWPVVRKFAVPLDDLAKGRDQGRKHWLGEECTVLFEDATFLPFDDLDCIDQNGLEVARAGEAPSLGGSLYPLALQFRHGEPDRPTAEQLVWLDLAMRAVLAEPESLDQGGPSASESTDVFVSSAAVQEGSVKLTIVPRPVYLESEARAAIEQKRKRLEQQDELARAQAATEGEPASVAPEALNVVPDAEPGAGELAGNLDGDIDSAVAEQPSEHAAAKQGCHLQ